MAFHACSQGATLTRRGKLTASGGAFSFASTDLSGCNNPFLLRVAYRKLPATADEYYRPQGDGRERQLYGWHFNQRTNGPDVMAAGLPRSIDAGIRPHRNGLKTRLSARRARSATPHSH